MGQANKSVHLNSFAIKHHGMDSLPSGIVNAKTVDEFKTKLHIDKSWYEKCFDLSELC